MREIKKFIGSMAFVSLGALIVGCGPKVSWTPLNDSPKVMQKRSKFNVAMFKSEPSRPHVVVGIFHAGVKKRKSKDSVDSFAPSLRKKAAKRGCEAIVLSEAKPPFAKSKWTYQVDAQCLVWTGDEAAPTTEPDASPAPAPAPEAAGCTKDVDCKGNRICQGGACVTPAEPQPQPEAGPADADAGTSTEAGNDSEPGASSE